MNGVSVIICCYNSIDRIVPTLEHLATQQTAANIKWEVILVNNNSTDHTVEVGLNTWKAANVSTPLIIVDQPIPGLSYAREKGIANAQYEFLLFCDDDNWLDIHYVNTVFNIMSGNDLIGALGGNGSPKFEVKPPKTIEDNAGYYATGAQSSGTEKVAYPHVYGAGCTYRRSALTALFKNGFKYQLTGRNGNKLLCGEDHELCYALYLAGYEIWASDKLKFHHFIPQTRMTTDYLSKNIIGLAQSNLILSIYKLAIANRTEDRSEYKNYWTWNVFKKGVLTVKNLSNAFKNRNDAFSKIKVRAELLAFYDLLISRNSFNQLRTTIDKSAWAKSAQHKGRLTK